MKLWKCDRESHYLGHISFWNLNSDGEGQPDKLDALERMLQGAVYSMITNLNFTLDVLRYYIYETLEYCDHIKKRIYRATMSPTCTMMCPSQIE